MWSEKSISLVTTFLRISKRNNQGRPISAMLLLPDYAIRLPYRAIDPVPKFISPDYSTTALKKSRIPDFRNTLYWNPSVKTDKEGKPE